MNELQEVEISIDARGEVKVEVRGVHGPGCLDITRAMEELLGEVVVERTRTHEYDLEPQTGRQDDWLRQGD